MSKLLTRLISERFALLVSLPRNDVALAHAALRGGAQGLKIHINVHHHASGTLFRSFTAERENIRLILEAAGDIPVGIVPGGEPFASEGEFETMAAIGVDFFDAYPFETPAWALAQTSLGRMLAAYAGSSVQTLQGLQAVGMQMCEASIMGHDDYGKDLTALDLAQYQLLCSGLQVPVIIPSQKRLRPGDMPLLQLAGAKAVLIGAVVTGSDAASMERTVTAFRERLT